MKYYQIDIDTSEYGIEVVCAKLLAIGIENTVVTDPADIQELMDKKESYEWDYVEDDVMKGLQQTPMVTVYTESEDEVELIRDEITQLALAAYNGEFTGEMDLGPLNLRVSEQDDSQWKDKWKEYFKPFRVAEHIVIKPSWEEYPDLKPDDKLIEIDPGMAFGTGTHETTSMCIQMLEKYLVPGQKVLDAGCGSGILSIAAVLLGASEVLGVDIDETAVEVARENLTLNKVDHAARAEYGDVTQGVEFQGDLVVANLMAELICMITPGIPQHLAEGGLYITSGILVEKEEMVKEALEGAGFAIVEVMEKGEWCCIAARKGEA